MTIKLEELEERLRELPLRTPDPRGVTTYALGQSRTPVRHAPRSLRDPWVVRPLAAVVALAVAWAVLYFAPAADTALADSPVIGHVSSLVLDQAGLGTGTSVTPANATAAGSGVTVQLLGASASPLRTVILVRFTPATYDYRSATLTDQFGSTYEEQGGNGDLRTGDWALIFSPPSIPASGLGMRYTLTLDNTWKVSGTVISLPGHPVHAPEAASVGSGRITFSDGVEAGGVMQLTAHVTGLSSIGLPEGKQQPGVQTLSVTVTDAKGNRLMVPIDVRSEDGGWAIDVIAYGMADHGTYRLDISIPGAGEVTRTVRY